MFASYNYHFHNIHHTFSRYYDATARPYYKENFQILKYRKIVKILSKKGGKKRKDVL